MSQDNWRFCVKCFSLWFAGNPDKGLCPAGGVHLPGTGNYSLQVDSGPGQGNWRWCHKCQGLFFNGNVTHGVCAAGGAHDVAGSADYILPSTGAGQGNWRWCPQCQGLFFDGTPTKGVCPAWRGAPGDTQHISTGSANFTLSVTVEQGHPQVSGNASVILHPQPPTQPFVQIGVSGSGFPPNASGHLCVQVSEDPECKGKNPITQGDFATMGGDMPGNFTFSTIVRPIPKGTNDTDMWSVTAIVRVPGPDPPVTAIGNVFVATFPPPPLRPARSGPA